MHQVFLDYYSLIFFGTLFTFLLSKLQLIVPDSPHVVRHDFRLRELLFTVGTLEVRGNRKLAFAVAITLAVISCFVTFLLIHAYWITPTDGPPLPWQSEWEIIKGDNRSSSSSSRNSSMGLVKLNMDCHKKETSKKQGLFGTISSPFNFRIVDGGGVIDDSVPTRRSWRSSSFENIKDGWASVLRYYKPEPEDKSAPQSAASPPLSSSSSIYPPLQLPEGKTSVSDDHHHHHDKSLKLHSDDNENNKTNEVQPPQYLQVPTTSRQRQPRGRRASAMRKSQGELDWESVYCDEWEDLSWK